MKVFIKIVLITYGALCILGLLLCFVLWQWPSDLILPYLRFAVLASLVITIVSMITTKNE